MELEGNNHVYFKTDPKITNASSTVLYAGLLTDSNIRRLAAGDSLERAQLNDLVHPAQSGYRFASLLIQRVFVK
jgi:hypothetical protein